MRFSRWISLVLFIVGIVLCSDAHATDDSIREEAPSAFTLSYNYNVICYDSSALLYVEVDPLVETHPRFRWSSGGPLDTLSTFKVRPHTSTQYTVSVYDAQFTLLGQVSTTIYVSTLPPLQAVDDTLCLGDEATVGMTSDASYFFWDTYGTTDTINTFPQFTTTYHVKASYYPIVQAGYSNNCFSRDSATALVFTEPGYRLLADSGICRGYDAELKVIGARDILWSTGETTPLITHIVGSDTLEFWVEGTDDWGCRGRKSIRVFSIEGPSGGIISLQDTLCKGDQSLLYAYGGKSYYWNTYERTDSIWISPRSTTIYQVKVYAGENQSLCFSTYTHEVVVQSCDKVYFPTAISLTGVNRVFRPIGISFPYNQYRLFVYNRWGQKLFESDDFNFGWNGTFQGENVQPGVYVYVFHIINKRDVWEKKGTITVVD